ncbi:hypothetical protein KDA_31910 [Dictyobacter alpinus]|uniref:Uncharacterized protein n=1 Tax=Dictyobacter alpinus TaxID=2014873 RepID=A0A402B8R0_9CHLR|nr:hypothetical protein KDA_31910 [Dictyobacter alpinus]
MKVRFLAYIIAGVFLLIMTYKMVPYFETSFYTCKISVPFCSTLKVLWFLGILGLLFFWMFLFAIVKYDIKRNKKR